MDEAARSRRILPTPSDDIVDQDGVAHHVGATNPFSE
jgi:hypothetical protein